MTKYQITYDIELLDFKPTLASEGQPVRYLDDGKSYAVANPFDLSSPLNWGLISPVCKYMTPFLSTVNYLVIQRRPTQRMFLVDEDTAPITVPIPWHTVILEAGMDGNVNRFGIFFNDAQIYTDQDPFYLSWLMPIADLDGLKPLDILFSLRDKEGLIQDSNYCLNSSNFIDLIFTKLTDIFLSNDIAVLNDMYNLTCSNHTEFLHHLSKQTLDDAVRELPQRTDLNIRSIHDAALEKADSIPTLSSILQGFYERENS